MIINLYIIELYNRLLYKCIYVYIHIRFYFLGKNCFDRKFIKFIVGGILNG